MHFFNMFATAIMAKNASAVHVSWDDGYEKADRSLRDVACSNGKYGLVPRFSTQGSLPQFPFIGGSDAIAGWNSPNCGTCFLLEHEGNKVKILAIDHAGSGFNIGLKAMNVLTNGRAVEYGHVEAKMTPLLPKDCGL